MKNPLRWLIPVILIVSCSTTTYEFVVESYPDGSPKTVRHYKDEDQKVLLREVQYYNDGGIYIEGTFKDGERSGTWKAWHRNGNLWSQGEYKNGKENGLKTVYYENGGKYYEGELRDDNRAGKWTFWNEEGQKIKSIDYDQP